MLSLISWVGLLSWIIGGAELLHGTSAWWLLATLGTYLALAASLSVGYHRLFTHRAFECSQLWHYIFGFIGTIAWHGSPIQWVALHITHHKYPDTDKDPHYTGWDYLLHKRYNNVKLDLWRTRRLMKSSFHRFIHEYYVLISLGFMWTLWAISPTALIFGYLMPMGIAGVVGGIHQVTAHLGSNGQKHALNLPWLEYIIPSMGEWNHAKHHLDSKAWDFRTKWWHLDTGAMLVKLIRKA